MPQLQLRLSPPTSYALSLPKQVLFSLTCLTPLYLNYATGKTPIWKRGSSPLQGITGDRPFAQPGAGENSPRLQKAWALLLRLKQDERVRGGLCGSRKSMRKEKDPEFQVIQGTAQRASVALAWDSFLCWHQSTSHSPTNRRERSRQVRNPIVTPAPCSHCSFYLHGSLSLPDLSPNPAYSWSAEPFAASSKKPPSPLRGISFPVRHVGR